MTASLAREAVEALAAAGLTVGTAESLTGGLLCAALVDVPGASAVVRGGVIAYAADLKTSVLGVDADLVADVGTVHPQVAAQLARGARTVLDCDIALATTGVAGPDSLDGHPVGTVHLALADASGVLVQECRLAGTRSQIREATVARALDMLSRHLGTLRDGGDGPCYRGPDAFDDEREE